MQNTGLPGQFYKPTVLADVTNDMDIAQNEVFGPVMLIFRTQSDDEAVELANNCKYALAGCVFSRSLSRAEAIAKRVQGGTIIVNDFGIAYLCNELPFGGVGFSGFGKFNGKEGLRESCNQKVYVSDRFPGVRNNLPPALQYPVKGNIVTLALNLLRMIYNSGVSRKLSALKVFMRSMLSGQA